jgi:hypothetical protein
MANKNMADKAAVHVKLLSDDSETYITRAVYDANPAAYELLTPLPETGEAEAAAEGGADAPAGPKKKPAK